MKRCVPGVFVLWLAASLAPAAAGLAATLAGGPARSAGEDKVAVTGDGYQFLRRPSQSPLEVV